MSWLPWKFRKVLISILEKNIWHVIKFWDEANGFIEGNIFIYLLHVKWSNFLKTSRNFQGSHDMNGK